MKVLFRSAVLFSLSLLTSSGCMHTQYVREPGPPSAENLAVQAELKWFTSVDEVKAEAQATGRPVFVVFSSYDSSMLCRRFRRDILETKAFADTVRDRFLLLSLDMPVAQDPDSIALMEANKTLAERYNVRGVPVVLVFSPQADLWLRFPWPTYRGKDAADWVEEFENQLQTTPVPSRYQRKG